MPELAIGGGITSEDKRNTIFLDTGYIISNKGLEQIPKDIYKEATEYVSLTKNASQRDVLAGHYRAEHIHDKLYHDHTTKTTLQNTKRYEEATKFSDNATNRSG